MLARLAAELQDIFPTSTPMLSLIFQNPAVAGLAESIAACNAAPEDAETVARLWQRVQDLSDEEVSNLLSGVNKDESAPNLGFMKGA